MGVSLSAMSLSAPSLKERFAAATGLVTLAAAFAAVIVLIVGLLGKETELYFAEATIAALVLTIGLREFSSKLHHERQTHELREQMKAVEEKNRLLNLTEASAHVGHWRIDLATDQLEWSAETFAIHGLDPGNLPRLEDAINYFHEDDRDLVATSVEQSRQTGNPYTFKARLIRADGELRHTESIARVEFDEAGKPAALFGVFRDRTDEEQMQQELRKARDEAQAMAKAKSAFLAKMSHEIRTPMNGVLGFAELLQTSPLDKDQRRHVDLIVESGRSLQTLLNDILDLTKIEAGHMTIKPEPVDIGHVVHRVAQLIEPLAREKALKVERVVDSALPQFVLLDGLRLRQILNNLMHNAVRFTDQGKIRLSAQCVNGQLEITVADTGIGISQEMQENVFAAFAQVDQSSQTERGGTGLGLAICQQLAELMSGSLSVHSIPGRGSAFTLTLPMLAASKAQSEPSYSKMIEAEQRLAGRRILLAEDFDINRELFADMAQRLGVELSAAEDGANAVEMVRDASHDDQPYELVLMDVRMPNMDGLQATATLREDGFDPSTLPILALTANAFADDVEACLECGMQEHLSKPISIDTLRDALERWLPEKDEAVLDQ